MAMSEEQKRKMSQGRERARLAKPERHLFNKEKREQSGPKTVPDVLADQPQALKRFKTIPNNCQVAYLRAMSGKSARSAIKAFCQMCFGWETPVADSIRGCTDKACPLYLYRPFRN